MKDPAALLPFFFTTLIPIVAYGLALIDWTLAQPYARQSDRKPGWLLAAGALSLLALQLAITGISGGGAAIWDYLNRGGAFLVLQAAILPILVEAGGLRAARLGANPFKNPFANPFRRRQEGTSNPIGWLVLALLLMLVWTVLLDRLWPHHTLPRLPSPIAGTDKMLPALRWLFLLSALLLAPILEESLFRQYLLYRLAAWGRGGPLPIAASILLTSLVWAAGHFGMLDPFWLKFTQISGLGMILGMAAWRHGLAAAITLHCAFNLSLIPLAAILK